MPELVSKRQITLQSWDFLHILCGDYTRVEAARLELETQFLETGL